MEGQRKGCRCRLLPHNDSGRVRWCCGEETKWKKKTKILALIPLILLPILITSIGISYINSAKRNNGDKNDVVTIKDFKTEFLTTGDDLDVSATTRFKKHKRGAPFERGRERRTFENYFKTWKNMVQEDSVEIVRKMQAKAMLQHMNQSVDPCEDFYTYACGNWENSHPIPEDRSGYDTFEQLRERMDLTLRTLLETDIPDVEKLLEMEIDDESTTHNQSIDYEELSYDVIYHENCTNYQCRLAQLSAKDKAKLLYFSCMNHNFLGNRTEEPLLRYINKLGGWPAIEVNWNETRFDLTDLLASLRQINNEILISQSVGPDVKNSSKHVLQLDKTSFGLPSRDYFLDANYSKYLHAYEVYMTQVTAILAPDMNITEDIRDVIHFEKQLAIITETVDGRFKNVSVVYNKITVAELQKIIPEIDWTRYFSKVLYKKHIDFNMPVVVYCTTYLERLSALIRETTKRTLANYLQWRFVRHRVSTLDNRFDEPRQRFISVILGRKESPPRWKHCVGQVNTNMGMALGQLFIDNYFDDISRNDTLLMTMALQNAFKDILVANEWLDCQTKSFAKNKTKAMRLRIGYPDYLREPNVLTEMLFDLVIQPYNYFENIITILKHAVRTEQEKIEAEVDKDDWQSPPATINAFYSRNKNQILVPSGILQPPFYHRHFPKALNYGGIGVVIGHEITHGFDDKGRHFDEDGTLLKWWMDESIQQFSERTSCLIDQYNKFIIPEINSNVDGLLTRGENIADNGGIQQSFKAYKKWFNNNPGADEGLPGFNMTGEQLFFLNFAQIWCGTIRPDAAKTKFKLAVHSPGRFRVTGTVANSDDFANVFKCSPGAAMNPKDKCNIW